MTKDEYFAKHRAGQRTPVEGADDLPKLFAKKMTSAEFQDCLDAKKIDGKDDFVVNYAKAVICSVVTEDGAAFYLEADLPDLVGMGVEGMGPFVKAINAANGLTNKKKDETADAKP